MALTTCMLKHVHVHAYIHTCVLTYVDTLTCIIHIHIFDKKKVSRKLETSKERASASASVWGKPVSAHSAPTQWTSEKRASRTTLPCANLLKVSLTYPAQRKVYCWISKWKTYETTDQFSPRGKWPSGIWSKKYKMNFREYKCLHNSAVISKSRQNNNKLLFANFYFFMFVIYITCMSYEVVLLNSHKL